MHLPQLLEFEQEGMASEQSAIMPATVLGKRSSVVAELEDGYMQTRAKRRITIQSRTHENSDPFVTRPACAAELEQTVKDALVSERPIKKCRLSGWKGPGRCGEIESTATVPTSKRASPNKKAQTTVDVYQDKSVSDERIRTPQTPRHRDALQKVTVTPRHRIIAAGDPPSQRSNKTPGTPSRSVAAVYSHARQLFARCTAPGKIIGRDSERAELARFVQSSIESQSGGCLYVSGPPGTGKSALLGDVLREYSGKSSLKTSVVNCMSVRHTKDLIQKLAEDLGLSEDAGINQVRASFLGAQQSKGPKHLVLLDEVDHLVDMDLDLLYSLFEWSLERNSSLILIGIANALDLTDRLLPRLKSRSLKPELLPFMPYSAAQIVDVLTTKLRGLAPENSQTIPFLQPAAIQFCAKKVAAHTGDLRKAFDICQRAIDLVANEIRDREEKSTLQDSPSKTPLMENCNLASPLSPQSLSQPRQEYTIETAPKATIAHMARVTAQAFSNGATQRLSTLNLQQKAVLCALAALEKRKRDAQVHKTMFSTPSKTDSSAPSIMQLFEAYAGLCRREKLFHALSRVEFRDVVSGLEALSLVSPADGRAGSFATPITPSRTPGRKGKGAFAGMAATGDERRVASAVSVKEISAAIETGPGKDLLREMLEGEIM